MHIFIIYGLGLLTGFLVGLAWVGLQVVTGNVELLNKTVRLYTKVLK